MSSDPNTTTTGKAGVIVAPQDADSLDKLAHSVLDDLLYNVVHDLLIKVHRDEKSARATTAAIKVEKLAADTLETPDGKPDVRIETDAAIYEDGKVLLRGNPLKTTKEILCPRCHLPRLLYPTDGKGARKPDPGVIYCKKHPFIEKTGYDIYGQTWVAPGPGRGKKKKDMEKKLDPNDPSSPAPVDGGSAKDRPPNVLSYPSATCSKCKRCILVTRLNNHMGSCIGNSGRNASRAAAQKISNGGSNGGSQNNDNTPPGSQKGTPLPGSRAASPRKRDVEELLDEDAAEDSDPSNPKKKKVKPNALTKKVILKTKPPVKKDKVKASSSLNVEQKIGDDEPVKNSTVQVAPKKSTPKGPSPSKKASKVNLNAKPPLPAAAPKKLKRDRDESESSGTLSSPPQ
ncbi:SAGA-associated factor 11 [Naviculisporaceae sp. PSN 640]